MNLWNFRQITYVFAADVNIWQPRMAAGLAEALQDDDWRLRWAFAKAVGIQIVYY